MDKISEHFFDLEVMGRAFPDLFREGLRHTLILSVSGMTIGLVLGMGFALLALSRRWWVRLPARVYIDIFRGLPAILTIFVVGVGLPLAGIRPFGRNALAYGATALGLISTAYVAEIFRAGIQSVDKGQMESARSVGMSYLSAMRLVVVPQGVRRVLPPLTNEFIALVKDSSLVFVLGLSVGQRDLFRVGQNVTQQYGDYSGLIAAGLVYVALTVPLAHLVNYMDRRLREGKRVAAGELPTGVGET